MQKLAVIASLSLLAGCSTIVTTPPASCIEFIPDSWKLAVPGAQLPDLEDSNGWEKFGVAQTGQLSKSNARSADIIHIFTVCEKKANEARPRRKILGIF